METIVFSLIILALSLTVANRTRAGFKFRPKTSIAISTVWLVSLILLSGGTPRYVYNTYASFKRDYIADSLMEETVKGKTFGLASHIDIKRDFYLESSKKYSYTGAFLLFGKPIKFYGSVELKCDSPRVYCMKADFFTTQFD
jgi:hypothetical protein